MLPSLLMDWRLLGVTLGGRLGDSERSSLTALVGSRELQMMGDTPGHMTWLFIQNKIVLVTWSTIINKRLELSYQVKTLPGIGSSVRTDHDPKLLVTEGEGRPDELLSLLEALRGSCCVMIWLRESKRSSLSDLAMTSG